MQNVKYKSLIRNSETNDSFEIRNSKLKIVFMGTPKIGATILEHLISSNIKLVGVITRPDKQSGRGKDVSESEVKKTAKEHKLPVRQPKDKDEFLKIYSDLKPDLGIIAAYGMIIPKSAIESTKYGILNVHPSLLPKYRGPAPISAPLLDGKNETGVTIMLLSEGMDEGDILAQEKITIPEDETAPELEEKLINLSSKMLISVIPKWIVGEITPKPQDHEFATYTKLVKKEDGKINWRTDDAAAIERKSRAFIPWPGVYSYWNDKKVDFYEIKVLLRSDLKEAPRSDLESGLVQTIDDQILIVTKSGFVSPKYLKLEGKNKVTAEEFLRGYPQFENSILK